MVDCGNPRCAQERRSFRRDIQSWSRKLSLILGLERIAADYVDEDTAKLLLNPYPAWEQELVQDFEPPKKCFRCDKKLTNVYKLIQRIIDDAKKGKENNGKICLKSLQDLLPFCVDFYTHDFGRELFSDTVKTYFLSSVQQTEVREEPELPAAVSSVNDVLANLVVPCPASGRSNKKLEMVGTHGCTEGVLNHPIPDVASVKLITNRPTTHGVTFHSKMVKPEPEEAVIVTDQDETSRRAEKELHEPLCAHVPDFDVMETHMLSLFETMLSSGVSSFVSPRAFPVNIKIEPDDHSFILEHRLNKIRRLHNLKGLNGTQPRPAHSDHLKLPLLINVVRKLVHQKFMEIKRDCGVRMNSYEIKSKNGVELSSPHSPYLPEFHPYTASYSDENCSSTVYRHIMKGICTNMLKGERFIPKTFGRVNESSRIGDTLKDIIAKSISEKIRFLDGSSDESSKPSTPDTNKIILGKSKDHCITNVGSEASHSGVEPKISSEGSSLPKRPKKDSGKPCSQSVSSDAHLSSSQTKKTRPKRGQYRKYNSQLLMDAVKAVQRGEMSVHRAGSYFGVPHSTLEYKVKERHLLRQKKPRDGQSQSPMSKNTTTTIRTMGRDASLTPEDDILFTSTKNSGSSSARSSISSVSSTSSPPLAASCAHMVPPTYTSKSLMLSSFSSSPAPASALVVSPSKDLSSLAWFQPFLSSTSPSLESAVGLIPSNLTLQNSASELLIKLQHKVQAKGSPFPDDSAFGLPHTKARLFTIGQASSSGTTISNQLALYNESVSNVLDAKL